MTALDEIRGRWPFLPPLRAEHVASDEDGWLYASITHDHTLQDGTVCNQHLATVDSDEEDAEFIAHAPTDVARLLAAVEGALGLHKPRRVQHEKYNGDGTLISYRVTDDGPCELCYPDRPSQHCEDCERGICEGVTMGGSSPWPCPTVEAITAALEVS